MEAYAGVRDSSIEEGRQGEMDVVTKEEQKQRIRAMLSDTDRKVADILLEDTLPQMQAYCQSRIAELERRLLDEKRKEINRYEIAITVCEREKISLLEDALFAMSVSDVSNKEAFVTDEDAIRFPAWIVADDKEIERYTAAGVSGTIYTNAGELETTFRLRKNNIYLDILQKCREAFAKNGLCWKNVNEAYLHKFYYLETNLFEEQEGMEMIDYSVDDSEFDQRIHKNIIPLWNVRYITIPSNDFPVMQENKINYQYDFAVAENTELIMDMSGEINGYCERYADKLAFFTDQNDRQQFPFWQIWSNDFGRIQSDYLILTNGVNTKMWSSQNPPEIVHSAWELARRVNSLSISDRIAYQGYRVLETYDKESDYVIAEEKSNVLPMCTKRSFLELLMDNISLPHYIYRNTVQYIMNAIQGEFREYTVICRMPPGSRENCYES